MRRDVLRESLVPRRTSVTKRRMTRRPSTQNESSGCRMPWFAQQAHLLQVAMTAGPFMTDHLFLSAATTVKQLGLRPFHVVQ
jgi:hypothetical protein